MDKDYLFVVIMTLVIATPFFIIVLAPNCIRESNYRKVHFDFSGSEVLDYIGEQNLTLVQHNKKLYIPWVDGDYVRGKKENIPTNFVTTTNTEHFIQGLKEYEVKAVLSDYLPFAVQDYFQPDTLYVMENYHYWYYINFENVGTVALVYRGQVTAFYGGD